MHPDIQALTLIGNKNTRNEVLAYPTPKAWPPGGIKDKLMGSSNCGKY